jgi:SAM-dependent methyltransferase
LPAPLRDPCRESDLVASHVKGLIGAGEAPETRIHPADEMYSYGLHSLRGSAEAAALLYFSKGNQIAWTAAELARWRFGSESEVHSALDFAAGYGRSTRFLSRRLRPGALRAAEIDAEAVRFQRDTLGIEAFQSPREASRFEPGRSFDFILAASFFSHLPSSRFGEWLSRLYGLLEPGGVLLFSTHGPPLLSDTRADWSKGIVFQSESETRRLDSTEYGTSYVTESFVRETARRECGREAPLHSFAGGLCASQDLYVLLRPPVPQIPPPAVSRFPSGELDRFEIGNERVLVAGWSEAGDGEPSPAVTLFVGSSALARSPSGGPGRRGRWNFEFSRSDTPPDAVVRIEGESSRGLVNILAMGTLRPHLRPPPDGSSNLPAPRV